MRHRKNKKTISSQNGHSKSLIMNQAISLILHEKIKTTHAKAKNLRRHVESLITIAKKSDLTARRKLIAYLPKMGVVRKLLEEIGPRYKERPGGYTRITKIGARQGDAAPMAIIELV